MTPADYITEVTMVKNAKDGNVGQNFYYHLTSQHIYAPYFLDDFGYVPSEKEHDIYLQGAQGAQSSVQLRVLHKLHLGLRLRHITFRILKMTQVWQVRLAHQVSGTFCAGEVFS